MIMAVKSSKEDTIYEIVHGVQDFDPVGQVLTLHIEHDNEMIE